MNLLFKYFLGTLFIISSINAEIIIARDIQSLGDPKDISPHQKVEIDKILQIAKENNIKVKFKAVPWKRALLMVEKGKIDGVIQASFKLNRAKYAVYPMKNGKLDSSRRLNDGNSYYIYRNIDSLLRWNGEKFLNSGVVTAMEKYAVVDDLRKHENIKIKTFTNNSEIVRKLAINQFDAYAGASRVTDKLLKKFPTFAKKIIKEPLPIRKKDYYLIFSKIKYNDKAKDMELIWNGLKKFN